MGSQRRPNVASPRTMGMGAPLEAADPAPGGRSSRTAAEASGTKASRGGAGEPWCVTIFRRARYRRLRAAWLKQPFSAAPPPDAASCGPRGDSLRRSRSGPDRNGRRSEPAGGKGRTGKSGRYRHHRDSNRPRRVREPVDAIRVRRHYAPAIVLRHGVGRGAGLNGQVRSAPRLVQ